MKKPTLKNSKIEKVMKEFKSDKLHMGKTSKIVKSPKQAIAIAISESKKVSKKK